jgi:hypothetical protein
MGHPGLERHGLLGVNKLKTEEYYYALSIENLPVEKRI